MNETLKRRLVGLAVLLGAVLLLSLLLPSPEQDAEGTGATRRVTLDLRASAPVVSEPTATLEPVEPVAASAAAPEVAAIEAVSPVEPTVEPATTEAPAHPKPQPQKTPKIEKAEKAEKAEKVEKVASESHKTDNAASATPKPSKPTVAATWFVQLGAFSDRDKAQHLLLQYQSQSFTGRLAPLKTEKGVLYRVWVGPYPTQAQAQAAQKRLDKVGAHGTKLAQG